MRIFNDAQHVLIRFVAVVPEASAPSEEESPEETPEPVGETKPATSKTTEIRPIKTRRLEKLTGGLSEDQRIRLIGELLCKGILCSSSLRGNDTDPRAAISAGTGGPEERIVEFLKRHRTASPSEMRAVLNLSRSGTYRALQRLLFFGQIAPTGGRTSAAAYRLVEIDPSRN